MNNVQDKLLDLRLLIGVQFTFYGIVLGIYGIAAHPLTASTHWNIDLWWGMVVFIFGIVFLLASARPQRLDD